VDKERYCIFEKIVYLPCEIILKLLTNTLLTLLLKEMERLLENSTATPESVWAALQESDRIRKENERSLKEMFAKTDRFLTKIGIKAEKNSEELKEAMLDLKKTVEETTKSIEKTVEETTKSVKETSKLVGGIANSNGDVAETYFVNSFSNSSKFAGQEYDKIDHNITRKLTQLNLKAQYDLILYNCTSVAIIEIKYKAKKDDIEQVLKKAKTFKQLFPEYANYNLYLGLAGLHVEPSAEREAIKQGIAVIKQVGDNMVINDKHLKVF